MQHDLYALGYVKRFDFDLNIFTKDCKTQAAGATPGES